MNWEQVAIQEGRICPSCKQPVSKPQWKMMQRKKQKCHTCRLAHWEIPLYSSGGSARDDNQDRDAWNRIRSQG